MGLKTAPFKKLRKNLFNEPDVSSDRDWEKQKLVLVISYAMKTHRRNKNGLQKKKKGRKNSCLFFIPKLLLEISKLNTWVLFPESDPYYPYRASPRHNPTENHP